MTLKNLVRYASLKGLNLLGTGDALHPKWAKELKNELVKVDDGFYKLKEGDSNIYFVTQTEVGTVFKRRNSTKRIHHLILLSDLESAGQLAEELERRGFNINEGRPVAEVYPEELVEIVLSIDRKGLIIPAHAWTPWWSLFGSIGGVDKIDECYSDKSDKIYALETGLSSDPQMNWRISALDRFTLISNSDAHSPWPWRIGREANVFDVKNANYDELYRAIIERKMLYTIEVDPAYGKYHWSGHRKCGVGPLPPSEVRKLNGRCPICGKKLTLGVEERVEQLADRPPGYIPKDAKPYYKLLPLAEIIATATGLKTTTALYKGEVWEKYLTLVKKFGNELNVLLQVEIDKIKVIGGKKLAYLIERMRSGKLKIIPGYDGVYGKLILEETENTKESNAMDFKKLAQRSLLDFI